MDLISNLKERGSSVLLTGHTGFKGTWMTLLLERLGIEVFGYSLEPVESSLYTCLNRINKINEVFDDIRNYDKLKEFVSKVQPTFIIHMAAQPLVLESYDKPKETFDVNVMGTINLLEISRIIESVKIVDGNRQVGDWNDGDVRGNRIPWPLDKKAKNIIELGTRVLRVFLRCKTISEPECV